jgi:DNA-binding transcriptional LysR family regulator
MYQKLLSQAGFSMERLAHFCAMADAGSIAAVAKGDPSKQSLISRQIKELESFFGVELVRRKGRGMELTEAGVELAAIGRENFTGLSDFAGRCKSNSWTARLVASNSVAQWLLLPRLKDVAAAHPNVRFRLFHEQNRDMISGIREGVYDVALVRKDEVGVGLRYADLGVIRYVLVIPKSLAQEKPSSFTTALASMPLALPIGGRVREYVGQQNPRKGLKIVLEGTSYFHLREAIRSGWCAGIIPEIGANDLPSSGFHCLACALKYQLCLVWTSRNVSTRPALEKLIFTLREQLTVERSF